MSDAGWGRWGPEDERGALNLADDAVVRRAAGLVRSGKVYSLALPISSSRTPAVYGRPAPERFTRTAPGDVVDAAAAIAAGGDAPAPYEQVGSNEDVLMFSSHAGTHMDALSHIFVGGRLYNGYPATSFTPRKGASRLAITATATVATRGVLLDIVGARPELAEGGMLPAGYTVTAADLEAASERAGVSIEPGDAVLVRTGWVERFEADRATPTFPQPGIGLEAARFLSDGGAALVGADNTAVEVLPFDGGGMLPVHAELIARRGVTLVEHLRLGELAADACHEFLLVIGALPVVGATGSPVNPVAIG